MTIIEIRFTIFYVILGAGCMDIVYIYMCLYIVYFAMYMLSYLYIICPAVGTKETSVRLVLFTTQFRTFIFEVKCGFYTRSSIL